MGNLKYDLYKESEYDKLYRIIALRDIFDIHGKIIARRGDLGGSVSDNNTLSQYGSCWINCNARVIDSKVSDNAVVSENSYVYDGCIISNNATVSGNSCVSSSIIQGYSCITDSAKVNESYIGDYSVIKDMAFVSNSRVFNGKVCEEQSVYNVTVNDDLSINLIESIRCQTGLIPINGKVIAYKQVNKNLHSFYDDKFEYEINKTIVARHSDTKTNKSCSGGLHFSNANCWSDVIMPKESVFLMAEIDLNDIITVQRGKIRCTKAKILGAYDPTGENGMYVKGDK